MKIIINWENSYSRILFLKALYRRFQQGSEYVSVLNISGLWIAHDFEYVSGSECASFGYSRVLKMPTFGLCQGYTGFRICLNNSWISLIMSGYVWICLNIVEYAWICLYLPQWLLFYVSPFLHFFYNLFSILKYGFLFERLQESRSCSLKEHEAIFLLGAVNLYIVFSCFVFS